MSSKAYNPTMYNPARLLLQARLHGGGTERREHCLTPFLDPFLRLHRCLGGIISNPALPARTFERFIKRFCFFVRYHHHNVQLQVFSMIRPPPLQLKLDNRFPHPVRTPSISKSESFFKQLYKASWKNPIIAVAGLNGLRYAYAAVCLLRWELVLIQILTVIFLQHNAFQDAIVDDAEAATNLFRVSIALGVMYMISFVIELYGIIGVSLQRLSLVRAYLRLTFLASVLIISAGVLNGIAYFSFAEELMWECMSLATEGRGYEKSLFRSRPWPGSVFAVSKRVARKQCIYAWINQSWFQVASVFLFSFIPAVIYYVMVYTYYRQTVDPNHHANLVHNGSSTAYPRTSRPRQRQGGYARVSQGQGRDREEGMTTGRLQPHPPSARLRASRSQVQANRSVRGVSSSSSSTVDSVTSQTRRKFVPRSLNRPHRPPPLMQSPSPVGFSTAGNADVHVTPGPPSYRAGHNYRPSRVYAAFAAPVPDLSGDGQREYDKFV
ncbi:hypothetical protein CPB84DRAFT_1842985 [Gymnopilus junonius]|uniref:Transmembrane protein n=1 Tax=Gymnopilus junonius TaxID=109634 RepID=A0A9P5NYK9_GYMJU|nr:hypothetical protein CPB84DRAFT_1842985 [Gymnopilus junonius]